MKAQFNKYIWIVIVAILLLYVCVISVLLSFKVNVCLFFKVLSAICTLLSGVIVFTRGSLTHYEQNQILKQLISIVESNTSSQFPNWKYKINGCDIYVKLVLYAMYKCSIGKEVKYTDIYPEGSDFIKLIINTIFSTIKSSTLSGYIGDDGVIVVNKFNDTIMQVSKEGDELICKHAHNKEEFIIRDALSRIDECCDNAESVG